MSIRTSDDEVIEVANDWLQSGHTLHLVTVVRTWGSSPRPVGSIAAVRDDGELVGSVSGGCVEKQLVESLATPGPAITTFHIDHKQALRVGLACGGELELVVEPVTKVDAFSRLLDADSRTRADRVRVRRTLSIRTGAVSIEPLAHDDDEASARPCIEYDGVTLSKVFGPRWRLLIIGAGQLSRYTAEFALALNYEVFVCDPRPGFCDAWRVNDAPLLTVSPDDAVKQYACDAHSAVLALSHDTNADDLALLEALPSSAFYVGALGSRRNLVLRQKRLAELGLNEQQIARLHAPIGLDIGSRSSAEIAISIVAQLIDVKRRVQQQLR